MPRAKPFSGKAKRQQLQERRVRKQGRATDDEYSTNTSAPPTPAQGPQSPPPVVLSDAEGATTPPPERAPHHRGRKQRSRAYQQQVQPAKAKSVKGSASSPSDTAGAGADGCVRSVFRGESKEEIDRRRRLAYLPLLGRKSQPAIDFGEWFNLRYGHPEADDIYPAAQWPHSFALPRPALLLDARAAPAHPVTPREHLGLESTDDETYSRSPGIALTVQDMKRLERDAFRRWVAGLDTVPGVNQFERNLDVWMQLWFTVERCDVVAVVADARYPIFHVPLSLVHFACVAHRKRFLVVLNKSDLVPAETLQGWIDFLKAYVGSFLSGAMGLSRSAVDLIFDVVPMCCAPEAFVVTQGKNRRKARRGGKTRHVNFREVLEEELRGINAALESEDSEESEESEESESIAEMPAASQTATSRGPATHFGDHEFRGRTTAERELQHDVHEEKERHERIVAVGRAIQKLLTRARELKNSDVAATDVDSTVTQGATEVTLTLGLVGHPNVGKSSLINAIKGVKSVSVSATPGHTKHMQTINIDDAQLVLLDCPGLCFPFSGVPRPLQAVLGTHQIAQTRDPQSGVAYLAQHLALESLYGLRKIECDEKAWTAFELCEAFALKRGFRVRRGHADTHRAAIAILQEAYNGNLVLYFRPPPREAAVKPELLPVPDAPPELPSVPEQSGPSC